MPPKGHSILSASSSDRWLHCPPSARLCETYEDKGSDYAAEGTDAHALCEYKLLKALGMEATDPTKSLDWYNAEMEDCATGYASFIMELLEDAKQTCSDPVVLIEQRVDFSRWVEQGFGTSDAILISDGTMHVIDYKHGLGILVCAEDNPQMKCYALGALELFDDIYDIDTVSSSFIVVTDMMQFGHDGVFVVGDGDVIPDPDEYQLADIACSCVERARRTLHIASPKVALLSYSTMGSDRGAGADKVRKAVQILSDRNVDFIYDGEMEADVALVPAYAADWAPRSPVAGQADVLVFPDLNTGNICCKMLEHVAGATVLGPLLQGLAKPVMDLSRASTVDTIVDTIVICCCDA